MSFAFAREGSKRLSIALSLPVVAAIGLCCVWIGIAAVLFQQLPPICTSECLQGDILLFPSLPYASEASFFASSPASKFGDWQSGIEAVRAAKLSMHRTAALSTALFDQLSNTKERSQYLSESSRSGINAHTFAVPSVSSSAAAAGSDSSAASVSCQRRCSLDGLTAQVNQYWIHFLQTTQEFMGATSELNSGEFPEPAAVAADYTVPPYATLGSDHRNRHSRRLLEDVQAESTAIMVLYPLIYGLGFLGSLCAWGPFCSMWVDNNCLRDKVSLQTKWRPRGGKCDVPDIKQEPVGIRYPPPEGPKLKRYGGFQSPPNNGGGDQYSMQVAPIASPSPRAASSGYPSPSANGGSPAWSNNAQQQMNQGPTFVEPSSLYNSSAPPSYASPVVAAPVVAPSASALPLSSLSSELLSARTVARVASQDAAIAPFVTLAAPPAWHTKEELQQQRGGGANPRAPPPPPAQPPYVSAPSNNGNSNQNQYNDYIRQQEQELQQQEQNVRLAQLELAVHRAQMELSRAQAEAAQQKAANNAAAATASSQQPAYQNANGRPSESSPIRQPRIVSTGVYMKDAAQPVSPSRPTVFATPAAAPPVSAPITTIQQPQQQLTYPSTVAVSSPTAPYSSPSPWSPASSSASPMENKPYATASPVTVAPVPPSSTYDDTDNGDLNPDDPTVLSTHGHGAVRVLSAIGKVHWSIRLYAVVERALGALLSIIGAAAAANAFNSIITPLIQVFVLNPLTQYFITKTKVENMRIGGRRLRWKKTFTMQEFWWRKLANNISFLATGGLGCCSNSWFNAWVDAQMEWEATGVREELFLPHAQASKKQIRSGYAQQQLPAEDWPFIWSDALGYWTCCGCFDCTKQVLPFEDKAPCCDCHPLYQLERQLTAFQFGSRRLIFSSDRDEFDREFSTLRSLNLLLTIISLGSWDGSMLNDRMCVWIDKNAKITIDADDGWFGPAQLDAEDMKDGFSKLSVVSGLGQAAAGAKGKYTNLISQAANIAQRVF